MSWSVEMRTIHFLKGKFNELKLTFKRTANTRLYNVRSKYHVVNIHVHVAFCVGFYPDFQSWFRHVAMKFLKASLYEVEIRMFVCIGACRGGWLLNKYYYTCTSILARVWVISVHSCVSSMLRTALSDGLTTHSSVLKFIGERFRPKADLPEWTSNEDVTRHLLEYVDSAFYVYL